MGESKIVELEEEVDDDPECFLIFTLISLGSCPQQQSQGSGSIRGSGFQD